MVEERGPPRLRDGPREAEELVAAADRLDDRVLVADDRGVSGRARLRVPGPVEPAGRKRARERRNPDERVDAEVERRPCKPRKRLLHRLPRRDLEQLQPGPDDLVDVPCHLPSVSERRRCAEAEQHRRFAWMLEDVGVPPTTSVGTGGAPAASSARGAP